MKKIFFVFLSSLAFSFVQEQTPPFVPIPVNATTYTFNTTLADYVIKGPGTIPAVATNVGTELAKRFYFLITLDDGTVLIPEPVRVLVTN